MRRKIAKFFDEIKLAALGVLLATRERRFWLVFVPVFIVFGTLISLLAAGTGAINLFFAGDFGTKIGILGNGFLTLFGRGRAFLDWLINFSLAALQATLIALIVLIIKKRKASRSKASQSNASQSDTIQNASIATGLALLGSGCPTCGTTLITPIIASVFTSSSIAVAGLISGLLTTVAFVMILWSLKKLGLETYVIIKDEKWRKKRQKVEEK